VFLKQPGERRRAQRPMATGIQKTPQTLKLINLFHVCISSVRLFPCMHGLFARNRRLGIPPESFLMHVFWWLFYNHKSLRSQDELIGRHPFGKKAEWIQESAPESRPLLPVPHVVLWVWKGPQKRAPVMEVFAEALEQMAVVVTAANAIENPRLLYIQRLKMPTYSRCGNVIERSCGSIRRSKASLSVILTFKKKPKLNN
jgi:hypothetical protein